MENPRECALDVLIKVDKKEELSHIAISNVLEKYQFSEKRDRAFFTRLVEGTLERQITIDYVADQFSKTKMKKYYLQTIHINITQVHKKRQAVFYKSFKSFLFF